MFCFTEKLTVNYKLNIAHNVRKTGSNTRPFVSGRQAGSSCWGISKNLPVTTQILINATPVQGSNPYTQLFHNNKRYHQSLHQGNVLVHNSPR